ncbi:MIP/aquaporin family protein [Nocardioides panzhihuensis]|uniref:Aquaporin Z n=1 Tax=Nocardioides panzhihuensis TaxID=860243 RepID=A0A7Z0DH37_9ACTN|nr:MIP family channel protein [Nocardioides panzhihuensis]NYI75392.1 aquaporin Z [Nocardioides panzhihuensis]
MTEESLSAAEPTFIQKLAAEVIGTFILVFLGCGSVVAVFAGVSHAGLRNSPWRLEVAAVGLAFGIAVVIGAYTFGRISGGHFNPAVTLGVASAGRIGWKDAGAYIGAQFVGATIGAIVLFLIALSSGYNSWNDGGLGANGFGDGAGTGLIGAILVELVLTFIFVFVILGVTDQRAGTNATAAPLAIGLALAAIHFVGIPLTGTSVNPARSFGPALFSGTDALIALPVFLIVPAIGGAVAGFAYPLLFNKDGSEIAGAGLAFGGDSMAPAHSFQWDQSAAPAAPAAAATPAATPAAPATPAADPTAPAAPETSDRTIVSGGAGGAGTGGQQAWQQPTQTTEGDLPVYEQDGWRWDYAKQEWVPIEQ